jgi:hypothetical protein
MSKGSTGCYRTDIFKGSTGCWRIDTSKGSKGCRTTDMSKYITSHHFFPFAFFASIFFLLAYFVSFCFRFASDFNVQWDSNEAKKTPFFGFEVNKILFPICFVLLPKLNSAPWSRGSLYNRPAQMQYRHEYRLHLDKFGPELLLGYAVPYWAMLHLTELLCTQLRYSTSYWAMLHPTELCCTLLSNAAPYWAMLHPSELRCTVQSYAAPYWDIRCTLLSCPAAS